MGISQLIPAEKAGVTRRFIQEVENGRSDVSLQTLVRLAAAMDMSLAGVCGQIKRAMSAENLEQFNFNFLHNRLVSFSKNPTHRI